MSRFATIQQDDETAVFEIEITSYDPGIYTGPMDGSYPAEMEFDAVAVSINDGPFISPVPDDIYARYEVALNEKAWEIASEGPDHDDYPDDDDDRDLYDTEDRHDSDHYDDWN